MAKDSIVSPGDRAPDFALLDQHGDRRALRDLLATPVLLVFYPADHTPGCTTQACDIRDLWSDFVELGITVVGISPDSVETHRRFVHDFSLPHILLADPDHAVLEAYNVWGEREKEGRHFMGVLRSSVLIGTDGTVVQTWRQVQAQGHTEALLVACRELLAA